MPDEVAVFLRVVVALARGEHALTGHVVEAEDDVLRGHDDRLAARGAEDVVGRHHQHAGLHLGLDAQRHVHGHLVAVEVGVEGGADQRVELDRLALDQHRLKGLDAETVEGRRAVEQHRVLLDDLLEDVPDLLGLALDHALGALDGGHQAALLELVVDEGLEQLERHLLGQPDLVELELGADDDDRAARVVDALAEQVLAEAARLAAQHVREGLERALVGAGDRLAAAAVVEQSVDGLLQHPLLVADDDLGGGELLQALEPVVAVDDAPVEIVEVRGRKTTTIEGYEGTQVRREHRDDVEHHVLGLVPAAAEGLEHAQALGQLLAFGLGGRRGEVGADRAGLDDGIDLGEQLLDRLGAHTGVKGVRTDLVVELVEALLGQDLALLEARVLGLDDDVALAVEHLLELGQRDVEDGADPRGQALEEPDVSDGSGEVDVARALAADLGVDDLDAALLAHDPAVLHALVLAAQALVVLDRPEDFRAEQSIFLRLEGPVVDGLGVLHLAVRALADDLRRGDADP